MIFLVSKYIEYCNVLGFCHLIIRNKGFHLFQLCICIPNSMLPWQNLIILDFLDENTSLEEYREKKIGQRPGFLTLMQRALPSGRQHGGQRGSW